MTVTQVKPVIDHDLRIKCRSCPEYGRNPHCPPQAPLFGHRFDLSLPVYAVSLPNWHVFTEPNETHLCDNPKNLPEYIIRDTLDSYQGSEPVPFPQALGVNVPLTLKNAGIPFCTRTTLMAFPRTYPNQPKRILLTYLLPATPYVYQEKIRWAKPFCPACLADDISWRICQDSFIDICMECGHVEQSFPKNMVPYKVFIPYLEKTIRISGPATL